MKQKAIPKETEFLLAAAVCVWETGGVLPASLMMLQTKAPVSGTVQAVLTAVCSMVAFFLAFWAILLWGRGQTGVRARVRTHGFAVFRTGLWAVAAAMLFSAARQGAAFLAAGLAFSHYRLILIFLLFWIAAELFVLSAMLLRVGYAAWMDGGAGQLRRFLSWLMTQPALYIGSLALSVLLFAALQVLSFAESWFSERIAVSFLSAMGWHMLSALVIFAFACVWLILFQRKMRRELPAEESAENGHAAGKGGILSPCAAAVCIAVVWIFTGGLFFGQDAQTMVTSRLKGEMEEGYIQLMSGDLSGAAESFTGVYRQMEALRVLASDGEDAAAGFYDEDPDDILLAWLYLSVGGEPAPVEEKIMSDQPGDDWYLMMLQYYSGQEELTQSQQRLQYTLTQSCIAAGSFSAVMPDIEDLYRYAADILDSVDDCADVAVGGQVLTLTEHYRDTGYVDEEDVSAALELAESHEENLLLQYAAFAIGSSYQADDALHYERTIEAAVRFDSLYDDGTRSDSELAGEKAQIAAAAFSCYDYETALRFYEAAYALIPDTALAVQCAACYERQGEYEKCAALARSAADADSSDVDALYLLCISSLKLGDMDTAIEAAGRLAELTLMLPADSGAEEKLYVCAEYMSMNDSGYWTDFTWCIYESLTQEQVSAIQGYPLLWDYMSAIYQCFMKKDFALALEHTDALLAVRGDLGDVWYLKGAIAYSDGDFENALLWLRQAETLLPESPVVLFSLANVCDALGDYETAYDYCVLVQSLLPVQDHGEDLYGISYHSLNLLNSLKKELGKE